MSVIRVHKNNNYTVMSNVHLRDKELSLKAKGLLSIMLSLPEDWAYSISGLCSICKESETAVKSALDELKTKKYVVVNREEPSKENGGRIRYNYDVYEEPKVEIQEVEKQGVENLGVEFQGIESMSLLNTNILNTNNINNNINNNSQTKFDECDFDYKIIKKANEITKDDTIINAIKYYLEKYRLTFNSKHPDVSKSALNNIIYTIQLVLQDSWDDVVKENGLKQMIDRHFITDYGIPIDYNIVHFGTEGIIEKQARNVGLITGMRY